MWGSLDSKELLQSFVDTAGMPKIFQKAQDTKQTVSLLVQNVCPVSCAYQFRGYTSLPHLVLFLSN